MTEFDKHITKLLNTGLLYLLTTLVLVYQPMVYAELYKWVDKEGHVNYTQSPPPPGTEGTTIKPPAAVVSEPAKEKLKANLDSLDKMSEKRQKQTEEKEKSSQEQAAQQKKCEQAKSQMASFERPRVSLVDPGGEVRALSEEERIKEHQKSQAQVKELCK